VSVYISLWIAGLDMGASSLEIFFLNLEMGLQQDAFVNSRVSLSPV
jgi:hypothetical protein